MSIENIFRLQLVLGYVASALLFFTYALPILKRLPPVDFHRAIATLHSFRFFGLVFIVPGVVGPALPPTFAGFSAYADLATALLAMLALLTVRVRPLFWSFVVAFNVVGTIDLVVDYIHAIQTDMGKDAGQLGAAYAIPVLLVPMLMITHVAAFYFLVKRGVRETA